MVQFRLFPVSLAFLLFVVLPSQAAACPKINGLEDVNCDKKLVIVTFGDSITYGRRDNTYYKFPKKRGYPGRMRPYFPKADIQNLGVPAEDTQHGVVRFRKIFKTLRNADYVIILEGINDYFLEPHSATRTKANLLAMDHTATATGAVTLIGSLTPVNRPKQKPWVAAVNKAILSVTGVNFNSLSFKLINTHDNLHPNEKGYDKMANIAAHALIDISNQLSPTPTPTPTVP